MGTTKKELIMQEIMIEFSKTVEMFGLTPLEARLFSFLYLSEKPLTLDDMSDALGKSKTSMSTNIRSLLELNLVTRVWKKGVRKDLYEANSQLFKAFMNFYLKNWIDQANQQKNSLEEIEKNIKRAKNNEELTALKEGLKHIIGFHRQLEETYKELNQD
ncbi:GbsR/MarR family transcriptional regulator [Oceanobacillus bengalensis]|uniref:HTH-type transcriptional regulator n=1 Tax=Oceanobacillus bengalensis TaxID=1435466 RepID=A0A494Z863_9BACI|nr:MarR family transcriptional regulator [Oceanobacillus bengalensis]RKQ18801.1 transcriptional regulator [Oceanobacillus bengalensis]